MYKNSLLNLGIRENRDEQSVNFCKFLCPNLKILGYIVEGYFHQTAAQAALKLRRASLQFQV
jgi:hypothetical protein